MPAFALWDACCAVLPCQQQFLLQVQIKGANHSRTCLPCHAEAIPDSSSESLQVLVATELLLLLLDAYACKQGTD